jgi:hypothetical protein
MSKTKTKVPKARNLHCLNAVINRPSAGSMPDERKELNRSKCREQIDDDDIEYEYWTCAYCYEMMNPQIETTCIQCARKKKELK